MSFSLTPVQIQETLNHIESRRQYIQENLIGKPGFVAEITSRVSDLANYVQLLPELDDAGDRKVIAEATIKQIQWESQLKGMPICLSNAFAAVVAIGNSVDLSEPDGVRDVYNALLQAIDINTEYRDRDPSLGQVFQREITRLFKEQDH